ncbi:ABC transporter substrate-binding protein [Leifsonia sp. TF02-11]|uniref:ABC transporter substrate-binding protein n=1 Tax=Leifsonia sp. TF02-11 TaxID=2815212 RepID=UPI001AA1226C|nr:ABC transporter substrate-binding protein [Leifsonia sp. TF02-11]MBO1741312.1 amino acid ABC transporter substrate-binding protein [Leifsonia sp. TF02-11]
MSAASSRFTRVLAAVGAAVVVAALAACSSTPSSSGASSHGLQTQTAGKLTIATGQPAYSPWVIDDKPQSGQGFEAAVAYAVAEKLGFAKSDVVWTRTTFDSAIAPGPKTFDLNIQQFTISADRKKAVDFSSPYYTTSQALVTTKSSPAASVTSVEGLKKIKIGVATATTTLTLVKKEVGGDNISVFNSNDDAVLALKTGQVDAVATDLPTAFYLSASQIDNGVVSGQFADNSGGDQFGIVLPKDSPNTKKVSEAVDALRSSGELDAITKKWLSTTVNVPVFK